MLEVYTHQSINSEPGAVTTDDHGGSARLATLGERLLQSVVMLSLFRRQPLYNATQLNVSCPPTVTIVSGYSGVWSVGIDRLLCF